MNTGPSSTQPLKETVTPELTTVKTTQDVTPKPLTDASTNGYQMARHQSTRPIFLHK